LRSLLDMRQRSRWRFDRARHSPSFRAVPSGRGVSRITTRHGRSFTPPEKRLRSG
jgi:hypothetical protein